MSEFTDAVGTCTVACSLFYGLLINYAYELLESRGLDLHVTLHCAAMMIIEYNSSHIKVFFVL